MAFDLHFRLISQWSPPLSALYRLFMCLVEEVAQATPFKSQDSFKIANNFISSFITLDLSCHRRVVMTNMILYSRGVDKH